MSGAEVPSVPNHNWLRLGFCLYPLPRYCQSTLSLAPPDAATVASDANEADGFSLLPIPLPFPLPPRANES